MGITEKEAEERLRTEGENVIGVERRAGPLSLFLGQSGI